MSKAVSSQDDKTTNLGSDPVTPIEHTQGIFLLAGFTEPNNHQSHIRKCHNRGFPKTARSQSRKSALKRGQAQLELRYFTQDE